MFSKRQPLPLEVEHLIVDTIGSLRPNLSLYATPTEAVEAAMELEKKFRTRLGSMHHMTLCHVSHDFVVVVR